MLSTTEGISSSWDSYHHCLQESLHDHDHPYYRHIPDNKNRQLKFGLDGKNPRKIMAKSDNEMVNLLRSKRPTTEDQVATSTSRVCADCRTSKTPLWRSGPAGPKSLCNACGIRYRKRRRQFDFSQMGREMTVKEKQRQTEEDKNLVLVLKGRKSAGKEEAEAALLLMSLSCGLCVHS